MIRRENPPMSLTVVVVTILSIPPVTTAVQADDADQAFRSMVEADWAAQERRQDRAPSDPEAVHDALDRAQRLLDSRSGASDGGDLEDETELYGKRHREAHTSESADEAGRLALYHKIRWFTRDLALGNLSATSADTAL